uniref:G_PROTEIN_RECEP_F1_2 domain-containing protein n=1 Tax=Panagrellus redivivus TaxID=6233 RepID=A0A7E4ZSV3_PANRE
MKFSLMTLICTPSNYICDQIWNGDESHQDFDTGDDMKVNEIMVFVGLSIEAVNVTVPRLYFSVVYCKVKPGSAEGKAGNIIILCMTIWTALWNYYNFI